MFWKKFHIKYKDISEKDPDIIAYKKVSAKILDDLHSGIMGYLISNSGNEVIEFLTRSDTEGKALEIGFGRGHHYNFVNNIRKRKYFALELSSIYSDSPIWRQLRGYCVRGDARKLPYKKASFSRVVSVQNLEHISDIDAVIKEVEGVLKDDGEFLVALPCEDGFFYNLGRELTTRRYFNKKYGINYDKVMAYEHVWCLRDLLVKLKDKFELEKEIYLPFRLKIIDVNLTYVARFRKKRT